MSYPIPGSMSSTATAVAPQPEVVNAEHELAEATHTLAVATEHLIEARFAFNEARERHGMLDDRVRALRKEHDV